MKIHVEYEVGDTIKFKSYSYSNQYGGTEVLLPGSHESLQGKVNSGKVVKTFYDYETGRVYHVIPSAELVDILKKENRGLGEHKLYLSEFDLESYKKTVSHDKDEDCTIDENTELCVGCGVYHGDLCVRCSGRGFHKENCD